LLSIGCMILYAEGRFPTITWEIRKKASWQGGATGDGKKPTVKRGSKGCRTRTRKARRD